MMFSNWLNLRRRRQEISPDTRRHEISPDSPKWSRHFSCSSFKDIQDLLVPVESSPEPYSPRLQVLHQARGLRYNSKTPPPTSKALLSSTFHGGVVLYYTSLHIVRKTFEECGAVRAIFHRLRIPIDERDVTMDSSFHDELHAVFGTKNVELPKVFIGGRYIGGGEEIKKLNESEELRKMVRELPPSGGRFSENCDMCGGWRFVVCERCNGSHKIFAEKNGFISCTVCNVQGLVRCSSCFPMHRRRNSDFPGILKPNAFDN